MSRFSNEDHDRAISEGWVLSERDDGHWEIQRLDDDPELRFDTDADALDWVIKKKVQTSDPFYARAIALDGKKVKP